MIRKISIIEAPSNLGLNPGGVQELASELLRLGLGERLAARRGPCLNTPPFDAKRDPGTGLLNPEAIRDFSSRLADAVGEALDAGLFPVVLGGDCSILLGSLLALRRRGRFALLFLDGHADFYQPEVEPNGEVASMDLALATGRGPAVLADIEGLRPLVGDENVFVLGHRDGAEAASHGSQPLPTAIQNLSLAEVRRLGVKEAARQAVSYLLGRAAGGFWIHLDADVLSDAVMPAVDYRMPDGLTIEELRHILITATASGRVLGLEVTIYNPRLDRDGAAGRALVDAVASIVQS